MNMIVEILADQASDGPSPSEAAKRYEEHKIATDTENAAYQVKLAGFGFVLHDEYPTLDSMKPNDYMQTIAGYTMQPAAMADKIAKLEKGPTLADFITRTKLKHYGTCALKGVVFAVADFALLSAIRPDNFAGNAIGASVGGCIWGALSHRRNKQKLELDIECAPLEYMMDQSSRALEQFKLKQDIIAYPFADMAIQGLRDNDPAIFANHQAVYAAEDILLSTLDKRSQSAGLSPQG